MGIVLIRCVSEASIEGSISERVRQCQTRNVRGLSILNEGLLVGFPDVRSSLRQADVSEDSECELACHFR